MRKILLQLGLYPWVNLVDILVDVILYNRYVVIRHIPEGTMSRPVTSSYKQIT